MPFMDPNNPDRPLTLEEIRAMLARGFSQRSCRAVAGPQT
jgi:hypothetical protein